jgi:23S rRNA pseudouridine1911/1915/1917 synthase
MQDDLQILFENEDLLVINKPSGVTVNRSETTAGNTLQDLIEKKYPIDNAQEPEFIDRSGIVHRLDKETSGALIIAKNSKAFRALQAQFKERRVEKEYLALAHGKISPEKGEINVPVGRLPWNRKRFGVLAGGRDAVTSYMVEREYLHQNETLSLVRLFPKTGRTHQIRVHLKYINHPIFSDELYAGRKTARDDRKSLERVFLHAEKITFFDPITNEEVVVKAPLPNELTQLLENLTTSNIIN